MIVVRTLFSDYFSNKNPRLLLDYCSAEQCSAIIRVIDYSIIEHLNNRCSTFEMFDYCQPWQGLCSTLPNFRDTNIQLFWLKLSNWLENTITLNRNSCMIII